MKRIVIGMTESDSHTVSLYMFKYYLEEHGFEVVSLGACVPLALMIAEARRVNAAAIVFGAQNGHSLDDLRQLKTIKNQYPNCPPIFVGGRIALDAATEEEKAKQALRELGVDHILDSFDGFLEIMISASNHLSLNEVT